MITFGFLAFIFCILNSIHVANLPMLIVHSQYRKYFLDTVSILEHSRRLDRSFWDWPILLSKFSFSSQPIPAFVNLKIFSLVAYPPIWPGHLIKRGQKTLMPGFENAHISAYLPFLSVDQSFATYS